MSDQSSPEQSPWGWKALGAFAVMCFLFLGFFWIAMSSDPDYMPSQKVKQQEAVPTASAPMHQMTEAEHANMNMPASAAMNHGH